MKEEEGLEREKRYGLKKNGEIEEEKELSTPPMFCCIRHCV